MERTSFSATFESGGPTSGVSSPAWAIVSGKALLRLDAAAIGYLCSRAQYILVLHAEHECKSLMKIGFPGDHGCRIDYLNGTMGAESGTRTWHEFNDARINGWDCPVELMKKQHNLRLVNTVLVQQISLSDIVNTWGPAMADYQSNGIVCMTDDIADSVFSGDTHWLDKINMIILPSKAQLASSIHAKLAKGGFEPSSVVNGVDAWTRGTFFTRQLADPTIHQNKISDAIPSDIITNNLGSEQSALVTSDREGVAIRETSAFEYDFDFEFYVQSYEDLQGLSAAEAIRHFQHRGIQEGRYCSCAHYVGQFFPAFRNCIDWRMYRDSRTGKDIISPLECAEEIASALTIGVPSARDLILHGDTKIPRIAKHGGIFQWAHGHFNNSKFNVLEIGSRNVVSERLWEQFIPNCSYTGFDVLEGDNVDVVGDVHKLSCYFSPDSFDLVISHAVLEHLAMPWIAAEEIARVLKVGGYIAVETHFSFSEHELPWHFFQFNANALEILFGSPLGFELVDSGHDNQIVGRYGQGSAGYLEGKPVGGLFCHSAIIAKKIQDTLSTQDSYFDWRSSYDKAIQNTMYPSRSVVAQQDLS